MENTITVIENTELSEVLTNSGLQLNEAELIKQSYLPYFEQLAEIKEQAKKINFENPTILDEKIARELRLKTVKIRTGSESVKDERKRIHSLKANVEQSAWNLIKSTCQLDEETFLQVEKKREIAEKARVEALKQERLIELAPYNEFVSTTHIDLGNMDEESYNNLLNGAKLTLQAKQDVEKKAEEERIAKEKAEAEAREQMRIENEKLKAEAEAREKELAKEREAARIEAEKQAAIRAAEQKKADELLETQRKQAAKEKAIADAKLKAEREAREKIEAEVAEQKRLELVAKKQKEDAEIKAKKDAEKAAKAPIKKQLTIWVDGFEIPAMSITNEKTELIKQKFEAFKKWAKSEIEAI